MPRVMINGIQYDTFTCEFRIFATIKKSVIFLFEDGSNGSFHFHNGLCGDFYVFTNRKGIKMLCVSGRLVCSNTRFHDNLISMRADVTNYMNSLLK